jgi:predicted nuclease with TOPRIM domain
MNEEYSSDYTNQYTKPNSIEYVENLRAKIAELEERILQLENESKQLNEIRKRKIEKIFLD